MEAKKIEDFLKKELGHDATVQESPSDKELLHLQIKVNGEKVFEGRSCSPNGISIEHNMVVIRIKDCSVFIGSRLISIYPTGNGGVFYIYLNN